MKLVCTWNLTPGSGSSPERITVRFEPRGTSTEVIVVHEEIASAPAREGHARGWEECLDGLEALGA